jgi:hypothetical protein
VSRARALVGIVALSALLAALSGCTAPATAPTPTPLPVLNTAQDWGPVTEIGLGSGALTIPRPAGPTALEVSVVCASGRFEITVDQGTKISRVGDCAGIHRYRLPLPSLAKLQLAVTVPGMSEFVVQAQFLRTIDSADPLLQAECLRVSEADQSLLNAQNGYRTGVLSSADWASALTSAFADINTRSGGDPVFDLPLPVLRAGFATAVGTPGSPPATAVYENANLTAIRMCADNGTPITTNPAEHG